jgi:hypothetical protein
MQLLTALLRRGNRGTLAAMADLTLHDLVTNRTMSPEMAATLATAAAERRSMLFVAIPRMAGKSTNMRAALMHKPAGTAVHPVATSRPRLGIPERGDGGYLMVSEISQAGFDDYLWGSDVREVFAALDRGFSLATALHASGPDEAFDIITRGNGVPDEQAARIDVMTYIRSIGPWQSPSRRVVAGMYEINGVRDGHPDTRLLQRWNEASDRFEVVDAPLKIGTASAVSNAFLAEFQAPAR